MTVEQITSVSVRKPLVNFVFCIFHLFCFCSRVGLGTKSHFLGSGSVCVGLSEAGIILSASASPLGSARVPVM